MIIPFVGYDKERIGSNDFNPLVRHFHRVRIANRPPEAQRIMGIWDYFTRMFSVRTVRVDVVSMSLKCV